MLQTIRERFTGPVAIFVIGAIGIALVISFGNMDTNVASGSFAARVNDEEIPLVEFRQMYQNQLVRQQELMQGELPAALDEQLRRNVLESMVQREVVAQYVRENRYRVDDQSVIAYIRELPVFQVGGEFSNEGYLATLASQGLTPEGFERDQRLALQMGQLENGIVGSAFYTPTEYRRFIELEQESRQVSFITLDPAVLAEGIEVGGDAIRAYYDAHPDEFENEESVDLEYIEISLADIGRDVIVDDAALRDYYDAEPDRYRTEEERSAQHILVAVDADTDEVAAEKLATEIYERLAAGEDFSGLAAEYSDDPGSAAEGGNLGWAGRDVFVEPFEAGLFSLQTGEISVPIRTEFGFHVIRLNDIRPGSQQSFDEVRDELADDFRDREAADRFYTLAERVDDLALENPDSLDVVASDSGLEKKELENFTRAGGIPFGYNQALVDAAFGSAVLDDGENSQLIDLGEDTAVVIRVIEHNLPKLQALEEVTDTIAENLRFEKAAEAASAQGEGILDQLRAGKDFSVVGGEYQAEPVLDAILNRSSDDVTPELLAAIFRAPRPTAEQGPVHGIALANGGYAVYRLDSVKPGRPEDVPREERDQRKQVLVQQQGRAETQAMIADLRSTAEVFVAPDLFAQEDVL